MLVVDTRLPERGDVAYYLGDDGDVVVHMESEDPVLRLPDDRPMIRLAYTGNHFLSVAQHPSLEQGVVREPLDMRTNIPANTQSISFSTSSSLFAEPGEASSSSGCEPSSAKAQRKQ